MKARKLIYHDARNFRLVCLSRLFTRSMYRSRIVSDATPTLPRALGGQPKLRHCPHLTALRNPQDSKADPPKHIDISVLANGSPAFPRRPDTESDANGSNHPDRDGGERGGMQMSAFGGRPSKTAPTLTVRCRCFFLGIENRWGLNHCPFVAYGVDG